MKFHRTCSGFRTRARTYFALWFYKYEGGSKLSSFSHHAVLASEEHDDVLAPLHHLLLGYGTQTSDGSLVSLLPIFRLIRFPRSDSNQCVDSNPNLRYTDEEPQRQSEEDALLDDDELNRYALFQIEKKGLDLGLSRGFSAKKAAKHMVGLAAASLPTNPGRRKRSNHIYRNILKH